MKSENLPYITNGDLTGNINGNPVTLEFLYGYCMHLVWTGTPVGNFKLQASCDAGTDQNGTGVSNWVDIDGTTVAAGGAAGSQMYNADGAYYKWVRLVYTASSSTGTLTVRFQGKGA